MSEKPWGLAVKAAIYDQHERCLLVRRSAHNHNFIGLWEWPGGKVDPGEDFATGLQREAAEETGLTIELTGLVGTTAFEMPKINVVILCMEARLIGGTVKLGDEHDAFAWVPLSDLPRYQYPPPVAKLMLAYARCAPGSNMPGPTHSTTACTKRHSSIRLS